MGKTLCYYVCIHCVSMFCSVMQLLWDDVFYWHGMQHAVFDSGWTRTEGVGQTLHSSPSLFSFLFFLFLFFLFSHYFLLFPLFFLEVGLLLIQLRSINLPLLFFLRFFSFFPLSLSMKTLVNIAKGSSLSSAFFCLSSFLLSLLFFLEVGSCKYS